MLNELIKKTYKLAMELLVDDNASRRKVITPTEGKKEGMLKSYCKMYYWLFKVCLVIGIIYQPNMSFCQPGSGLLYFEKIRVLKHSHSDIKLSIQTAPADTFFSIDSTRIKFPFTKKTLFSLNKGKGNYKVILENEDKKMNIYLSNLLWGKDYGLLKFSFKEGDFIINATISTPIKLSKVCGCYDLSKKIQPQ